MPVFSSRMDCMSQEEAVQTVVTHSKERDEGAVRRSESHVEGVSHRKKLIALEKTSHALERTSPSGLNDSNRNRSSRYGRTEEVCSPPVGGAFGLTRLGELPWGGLSKSSRRRNTDDCNRSCTRLHVSRTDSKDNVAHSLEECCNSPQKTTSADTISKFSYFLSNDELKTNNMVRYESTMEGSDTDRASLTGDQTIIESFKFLPSDDNLLEVLDCESDGPSTVESHAPGMTMLECIVKTTQGTKAAKKLTMRQLPIWIWLARDLATVHFKSGWDKVDSIPLKSTAAVKLENQKLIIDSSKGRHSTWILFSTGIEATVWFSALQCLVSPEAHLSLNGKVLKKVATYNLFKDTYEGNSIRRTERWNKYSIISTLFGYDPKEMYLVFSSTNRRLYSAIIPTEPPEGPYAPTKCVPREIAILKGLSHPNIVQHKDIIHDSRDDKTFIVMEYVTRGCIVADKNIVLVFPEVITRRIVEAIAKGLEYLHTQSVAHRNVAPDNIVRDADGTYKLHDFRFAAMYDAYNGVYPKRTISNHPPYTAPELCPIPTRPSAPPENYACDIWSLGATAYRLLYGNPPFLGVDEECTYKRICGKKLHFPDMPKVSKKAKDLLEKMLSKDLKKRPTAREVLKNPWIRNFDQNKLERFNVTEADVLNAVTPRSWE